MRIGLDETELEISVNIESKYDKISTLRLGNLSSWSYRNDL